MAPEQKDLKAAYKDVTAFWLIVFFFKHDPIQKLFSVPLTQITM
jgi:hypothetical protein